MRLAQEEATGSRTNSQAVEQTGTKVTQANPETTAREDKAEEEVATLQSEETELLQQACLVGILKMKMTVIRMKFGEDKVIWFKEGGKKICNLKLLKGKTLSQRVASSSRLRTSPNSLLQYPSAKRGKCTLSQTPRTFHRCRQLLRDQEVKE